MVHGGVLSTILDEIMGWTVISLLNRIGVTRTLTVDFLRAVNTGQQLKAVGSVLESPSERTATIFGAIYDDSGRECARASGKFSIMQTETAVRLGLMSPEFMRRFGPIVNSGKTISDRKR